MADGCFANILRLDTQMCTRAGAEVAQQSVDGRHGAKRVVAEADGQGSGANVGKGQGSQAACAGELFEARAEGTPVLDHAGRGIFKPTQALAGEVAAHTGQQRHDSVPFGEHLPALCRRVVAPVGKLRAHSHQMANSLPGRRQARRAAAKAVANHVDRLAGVFAQGALEHGVCVQCAPV